MRDNILQGKHPWVMEEFEYILQTSQASMIWDMWYMWEMFSNMIHMSMHRGYNIPDISL